MILHDLRDRVAFLSFIRGRDEGDGETLVHVPFDVTVQEPRTRVIRTESNNGGSVGGYSDRVSSHRVDVRVVGGRVLAGIIGIPFVVLSDDLEFVSVQVERVEPIVGVDDGDLNHVLVFEDKRIGHDTVHAFIVGILTHGHLGKERRGTGHLVCGFVERCSGFTIVKRLKDGGDGDFVVGLDRVPGFQGLEDGVVVRREFGIAFFIDFTDKLEWFALGRSSVVFELNGVVEDEVIGNDIVHGRVLPDHDGVVCVGVTGGFDQEGVTLSDGDGEQVDFGRDGFDTIGFNDLDLVVSKGQVEHGQGTHVDDSDLVLFTLFKRKNGLVVCSLAGHEIFIAREVLFTVCNVDEGRLRHGFGTGRVPPDQEFILHHLRVFLGVPVTDNNGIIFIPCHVIGSRRLGQNNQGGSETINVLTVKVSVDPVGTVLVIDGNLVRQVVTWRDSTLGGTDGSVKVGCVSEKDAVRVERCSGAIETIVAMDPQRVAFSDDNGGWSDEIMFMSLAIAQDRERLLNTYGHCPLTPMTLRSARPLGLAVT